MESCMESDSLPSPEIRILKEMQDTDAVRRKLLTRHEGKGFLSGRYVEGGGTLEHQSHCPA